MAGGLMRILETSISERDITYWHERRDMHSALMILVDTTQVLAMLQGNRHNHAAATR